MESNNSTFAYKLSTSPATIKQPNGSVVSTSVVMTGPEMTETVAELMTALVVTIAVDAALTTTPRLMLEYGLKRLPVVDGDGRLVGLLGRASLLRGLMAASSAANEE